MVSKKINSKSFIYPYLKKEKDKKALSSVISAFILVSFSLVLIAIVFVIVNHMIQDKVDETNLNPSSYDKIKINRLATCKNISKGELKLSIEIGDIDVDGVYISISDSSKSETFEITNSYQTINNLKNSSKGNKVILPEKKASLIYYFNYTTELGDLESIKIAPRINGELTEVTDTLLEINNCA